MKYLSFILLVAFAFEANARPIYIEKNGGRRCSLFSKEVCYDRVIITDTDELFKERCLGSGPNKCPKVGYITIGATSVNVDAVLLNVEDAITNGSSSGFINIVKNGVVIGTVSYSEGSVNSEGIVSYKAIIDEI